MNEFQAGKNLLSGHILVMVAARFLMPGGYIRNNGQETFHPLFRGEREGFLGAARTRIWILFLAVTKGPYSQEEALFIFGAPLGNARRKEGKDYAWRYTRGKPSSYLVLGFPRKTVSWLTAKIIGFLSRAVNLSYLERI